MENPTLTKQSSGTIDDRDIDNVLFNDKKGSDASSVGSVDSNDRKESASGDEMDGKEEKNSGRFSRSSLVNVLPMDKLSNGASTASKVLGSTFSFVKEKTTAGVEYAKHTTAGSAITEGVTNAGSAVSAGVQRVATVGSEQVGKVTNSEAYKKSSGAVSGAFESAKSVATAGAEKARSGATTGIETIKSKVSGAKPAEPKPTEA